MLRSLSLLLLLLIAPFIFAQELGCVDPFQIDFNIQCTSIFDPVCGCDGQTYSNSCVAQYYNGVTSWTSGDCIVQQNFGCLDLADIDFGPCDLVLGFANINGSCVEISGCSSIVNGADYSDYIYPTSDQCELACSNVVDCIDPDLIIPGSFCLTVVDPVCGCNGITYNNACEAVSYYGVVSYTDGPCPFECVDPELIDPEAFCASIFDPVCGCDGVSYDNACEAETTAGITTYVNGPCPDIDNDGVTDYLDCAPFDPQVAPGFPCDDGDPDTFNDTINDCCECVGEGGYGGSCPADINNDLVVNTNDLLILLSEFGVTCEP